MKKVCPKRTPQSPFICSLLLCLSCTTCVLIFFELTRFFTNSFLALYLFIVVQFSRTDSSLSRNLSLTACILYHIIQRLSRPFCKVFRVFFRSLFRPLPRFPLLSHQTLSDATLLFYHILFVLSSAFAKFLQIFCSVTIDVRLKIKKRYRKSD